MTDNKRILTAEDFTYMENEVLKWNKIAGNLPEDSSLINTYISLCIEEAKEGVKAEEEDDKVEHLDALCDSVFTGFFLNALHKGVTFPIKNVTVETNDDGLDFEHMLSELQDKYIFGYMLALVDALGTLSNYYDLLGAFNRVLTSNMSKYIPMSQEVDLTAEIASVEGQGRYGDVFVQEIDGYYILRAKKDLLEGVEYKQGKIVKPSTFMSVEDLGGLEEFIYGSYK